MSDEQAPSTPLIDFLRETGAACPMCRYYLKGVKSERCPECGYQLHLTIARPMAGFGWWLAGVFGLAGLVGLLLYFLWPSLSKIAEAVTNPQLKQLVQRGFVPSSDLPNWRAVFLISTSMIVCLGLMAMIIGSRRRLTVLPLKWQIICGSALLLSPLIMLILIAALT